MEGGTGSIVLSTGMAALCAMFFTLLKAGDHPVASKFVFGNTNSVFGTLADLGVQVTTVDATDAAQVQAAGAPHTRRVFVETIANPGMQVPDLEGIGARAATRACCASGGQHRGIALPVPPGHRGRGAWRRVSLTKTIGGHGDALGGAITAPGLSDWAGYPNIFEAYPQGVTPKSWGLAASAQERLARHGRHPGFAQRPPDRRGGRNPGLAHGTHQRHRAGIGAVAGATPGRGQGALPAAAIATAYARARKHFKAGSWLLSFELKDPGDCLPLCNRLRLPIKATGLADTRTLIIPVAHTIFWEAGPEVRANMGIGDSMIRLSVGLEDAQDLLADFGQALAG